jgi:hypothetical protein
MKHMIQIFSSVMIAALFFQRDWPGARICTVPAEHNQPEYQMEFGCFRVQRLRFLHSKTEFSQEVFLEK